MSIARLLELVRGWRKPDPTAQEDLQRKLGIILEKHGFEPVFNGSWVEAGSPYPAFSATQSDYPGNERLGALAIHARLDATSTVLEEFAIMRRNDPAELAGALSRFSMSMLHPILSACGAWSDDPHTTRETWHSANYPRLDVWFGDAATYHPEDAPPVDIPPEWIDHLQAAISGQVLRPGFNWASLYCSRMDMVPVDGMATLNNDYWPAGWEATARANWPNAQRYYGVRLFIVMRAA